MSFKHQQKYMYSSSNPYIFPTNPIRETFRKDSWNLNIFCNDPKHCDYDTRKVLAPWHLTSGITCCIWSCISPQLVTGIEGIPLLWLLSRESFPSCLANYLLISPAWRPRVEGEMDSSSRVTGQGKGRNNLSHMEIEGNCCTLLYSG